MTSFRRQTLRVGLCAVLLLFGSCLHLFAACDEIPAGQTIRVRLLQSISSFSAKPGMSIRGTLLETPQCDGLPYFPLGTEVDGRVVAVHKIGMGFHHETAALEIEFDWISPEGAKSIEMHTRVLDVDDARESVKNGMIHGVRQTDSPQNRYLFAIGHAAALTPHSFWIPAVSEGLFPIAPEPEIYFPAGTDLLVQLTEPLPAGDEAGRVPAYGQFDEESQHGLDALAQSIPERTYNTKGRQADVVNLIFLGSEEQINSAFQAAGWNNSDPLSARSVMRGMHAVFALRNYARLPMAHHLLDGQPAESDWEKGLDSYAKRDHLRIWAEHGDWQGQKVWASASTGETGATYSFRTGKFVHHVRPEIDDERQKVVRDLSAAGCVDAVYHAQRPGSPHLMQTTSGTDLITDGAVAVVQLTDCQPQVHSEAVDGPTEQTHPHSKFARTFRDEVLSVRNIWRENLIYDAVRLSRSAVHSAHENRAERRRMQLATAELAANLPAQ